MSHDISTDQNQNKGSTFEFGGNIVENCLYWAEFMHKVEIWENKKKEHFYI